MTTINAQDLNDYQWKNRLVVILNASQNNSKVEQQLNEFKELSYELTERRLIIHAISPALWQQFDEHMELANEEQNTDLFENYAREEATDFEVLLIGLDGTIKSRYNHVVSAKDIFNNIDSMQMRKAEIRKDKK
jgi:UDP-galactopyranose mutase